MQIIIDVHRLVYVWCVVIYRETAWNNLFINLMASECLLFDPELVCECITCDAQFVLACRLSADAPTGSTVRLEANNQLLHASESRWWEW